MVKFLHKKHINKGKGAGRVVIYYSLSDIFLGVILVALSIFFMNDYLSHTIWASKSQNSNYTSYQNSAMMGGQYDRK